MMQMVNESNAPAPLSMAVVPQSFLNGLMDEVREVKSLLQKKSEVVKLFGGNFIRFVYVLDENNKLLSCTKNVDTLPGYLAKIVK